MGTRGSAPAGARQTGKTVRLGALAVLCALLPLLALGAWTLSKSEQAVRTEVAARLRLTTALSGGLIAEKVTSIKALVESAAKRPQLIKALADGRPGRFDRAEIDAQLEALEEYRDGRAASGLLDLAGVAWSVPAAPHLVSTDFSGRGYFKGLTASGSTYLSEAFVSAVPGHPFVVSIATYVRAPSTGPTPGRPLGVLVASVQLDEVQRIVDEVAAVQGVDLWIADQKGQLVAAPGGRPAQLQQLGSAPIGAAATIPADRLIGVDIGGEDTLAVRRPVAALRWTVFAAVPRDAAYAGADSTRTTVLAIGIPLALVVCAGIALLLRTQRRQWQAEAEATAARDQARAASVQKSDFLSSMSHELRTPLNAILGFSDLMAEEDADGDTRSVPIEWINHVRAGGRHLLELINDVLDLSKVEAGRLELVREPLNLPTVIDESVAALTPLIGSNALRVTAAVPPLTVPADRVRFRQILDNLLSNAIKFTPHGGDIFITGHRTGDRVHVSVTDTGPGISAADHVRVFAEFTQVGDVQLRTGGTGLGLPLARRLAQAHGGELTVTSEPGHGARFTVTLPAAPHAPAADYPSGGILVIEDDPSAALLLRTHLERAGYRVSIAATGEDGLAAARTCQPALILLDLVLPGIHGRAVLQQLKDDPQLRHIPVAIISVAADREVGIALGAVDYFTKPINHDALLAWLVHHSFIPALSDQAVNVLVVDDDPATLSVVGRTLARQGIRVVDATDGLDGLRLARAHGFDLIICDLNMPGLDGSTLIAALHEDPATRDVPVLVLTAQDLSEADRHRLAGRTLAVVSKSEAIPADLDSWLQRVAELTAVSHS